MIDYADFSVERFAMDEAFQRHVRHPTNESNQFWDQWLERHPHKVEEFNQARLLVLTIDFKKTLESEIPRELLFRKIQASIRAGKREAPPTTLSVHFYYKIAAVFFAFVLATFSLYFLTRKTIVSETTVSGEIRQLTLPDGSKVFLNANSSLAFNQSWEPGEDRKVMLTGEAFFDIVHTPDDDKFFVETDEALIEVLGTEFNVNARRDFTRVVLASGQVKISRTDAGPSLYLEPGDLVEVDQGGDEFIRRKVDPKQVTSWTKHQFIFKATPLGEIAQTLEDHYGWSIEFEDDSMKSHQFTGSVSTTSVENVEVLLFTISESFNLRLERNNDQLIFKTK